MQAKTEATMGAGWFRVQASTPPRNGPEQGVARSVARQPEKKAAPRELLPVDGALRSMTGRVKTPKRESDRAKTSTARARTVAWLWNICPQRNNFV